MLKAGPAFVANALLLMPQPAYAPVHFVFGAHISGQDADEKIAAVKTRLNQVPLDRPVTVWIENMHPAAMPTTPASLAQKYQAAVFEGIKSKPVINWDFEFSQKSLSPIASSLLFSMFRHAVDAAGEEGPLEIELSRLPDNAQEYETRFHAGLLALRAAHPSITFRLESVNYEGYLAQVRHTLSIDRAYAELQKGNMEDAIRAMAKGLWHFADRDEHRDAKLMTDVLAAVTETPSSLQIVIRGGAHAQRCHSLAGEDGASVTTTQMHPRIVFDPTQLYLKKDDLALAAEGLIGRGRAETIRVLVQHFLGGLYKYQQILEYDPHYTIPQSLWSAKDEELLTWPTRMQQICSNPDLTQIANQTLKWSLELYNAHIARRAKATQ